MFVRRLQSEAAHYGRKKTLAMRSRSFVVRLQLFQTVMAVVVGHTAGLTSSVVDFGKWNSLDGQNGKLKLAMLCSEEAASELVS